MSVILAYNGGPASRRALDFAMEYAKMSGKSLYIYTSICSEKIMENEEEMEKIRTHMKEAEDIAKAEGIKVHTVIEPGPVGENILSAASRFESTLIVIGRSDKTILDRVVLGSVSQYVVDHAKLNVTVIH
jgi:nucleotide-binding universal stress UspA family protein